MQPQLPDDLIDILLKYDNRISITEKSLTNDAVPIGAEFIWPASISILPFNYMPSDGRAIDRIGYATLFSQLGTTYGIGDGGTTFNIPNRTGAQFSALPTWTGVTFSGNWTNFGSGYMNVQYSKAANGEVTVQGMAKKTTVIVAGDTILTLPVNFRPTAAFRDIGPTVPDGATHTFAVLEVLSTGVLQVVSTGVTPSGTVNSLGIDIKFDSGVLPTPATANAQTVIIKVL